MVHVVLLLSEIHNAEHKRYLEENREKLSKQENQLSLFTELNFYWSPFSYSMLQGLLENLVMMSRNFKNIRVEMGKYDKDVETFAANTPLDEFCHCEAAREMMSDTVPPPDFHLMVIEHEWPETVTLKNVEEFRKHFFCKIALSECAMLVSVHIEKYVKVIWSSGVQVSDFQRLRKKESTAKSLKYYNVHSMEISGMPVYHSTRRVLIPPNVSQVHFHSIRVRYTHTSD